MIRTSGWADARYRVALAALFVGVAVAQVDWIRSDENLLINVDARRYFFGLLDAQDRLASQGWPSLPEALTDLSLGGRPPLYPLLAAPFVAVFGRSEDAAVLVNLLFGAVLLASTFAIGARCRGPGTGLLAALLVACYPPVVQLGRTFLPHSALPACVALSVALLLRLLALRSVAASCAFGASLAFGLLLHPSFALAMGLPTLIFGIWLVLFSDAPTLPSGAAHLPRWVRGKLRTPLVLRGLVPAALGVVALVGPWYATAGRKLFNVYSSYEGSIEDFAVRGFEGVAPGPAWYLVTAPGALTNVLALLAGAGWISALLRRDFGSRVVAVTFAAAYLGLLQQPSRAWWYFAAVLPIAATLSAIFLADLRPRGLSRALAGLGIATAVFAFATVSWGTATESAGLARALGSPIGTATCGLPSNMVFCPQPPQRIHWRAGDILRFVLGDPRCRARTCRLLVMQPVSYSPTLLWRAHAEEWPDTPLSIERFDQARHPGISGRDYLLYIDRPPVRVAAVPWPTLEEFQTMHPAFADLFPLVRSFELPSATARLLRSVESVRSDSGGKR